MLRVEREEEKERRRLEEVKNKIKLEKQMRDKQLKEIMQQRKKEIRDQKQIDKFVINKIKEEQAAEIIAAKKARIE